MPWLRIKFRVQNQRACIVIFSVFITLPAVIPSAADGVEADRSASASEEKSGAERSLEKKIQAIEIRRMPLAKFLAHLQQAAAVDLVIRWPELNRIGVYSDSRVTLTLQETTIGQALREGLRLADRGARGATFAIRDGMIVVTTTQDLAKELEVRVYEIRSIIAAPPSEAEQREVQEAVAALWKQNYHVFSPPWQRFPRRWAHEGRSRTLNDRSLPPRERETRDILEQIQELATARRTSKLIRTLRQTVDPASWQDYGGEACIEALDGNLIIRQSAENHVQIAQLLHSLQIHSIDAKSSTAIDNADP